MDKQAIADAYHSTWAVTFESTHRNALPTVIAYTVLAQECLVLASHLRVVFDIREIAEADPYKTAADMFQAIECNRFVVSNLYCEHPLWTPAENIAFRIVHDIYGHWGRKGDNQSPFSWAGEQRSYQSQCRFHSRQAQRVLFTEIVGQTAVYSLTGEFPEQKAILLSRELDV